MNLELAKLHLKKAETFVERQDAIEFALKLGMPLAEIEQYLDWVDHWRKTPIEFPQEFIDTSDETEGPSEREE